MSLTKNAKVMCKKNTYGIKTKYNKNCEFTNKKKE